MSQFKVETQSPVVWAFDSKAIGDFVRIVFDPEIDDPSGVALASFIRNCEKLTKNRILMPYIPNQETEIPSFLGVKIQSG